MKRFFRALTRCLFRNIGLHTWNSKKYFNVSCKMQKHLWEHTCFLQNRNSKMPFSTKDPTPTVTSSQVPLLFKASWRNRPRNKQQDLAHRNPKPSHTGLHHMFLEASWWTQSPNTVSLWVARKRSLHYNMQTEPILSLHVKSNTWRNCDNSLNWWWSFIFEFNASLLLTVSSKVILANISQKSFVLSIFAINKPTHHSISWVVGDSGT